MVHSFSRGDLGLLVCYPLGIKEVRKEEHGPRQAVKNATAVWARAPPLSRGRIPDRAGCRHLAAPSRHLFIRWFILLSDREKLFKSKGFSYKSLALPPQHCYRHQLIRQSFLEFELLACVSRSVTQLSCRREGEGEGESVAFLGITLGGKLTPGRDPRDPRPWRASWLVAARCWRSCGCCAAAAPPTTIGLTPSTIPGKDIPSFDLSPFNTPYEMLLNIIIIVHGASFT